ncbi:MAG TPA: hypothetical protein DDY78_26260 [Planctomycetales bacterium]|jgi:hypothetical protein|nr:hypothetical protein [Planctomycetales bacterium]
MSADNRRQSAAGCVDGRSLAAYNPLLSHRQPIRYGERFVASSPGGVKALEAFAKGLRFELAGEPEVEYEAEDGKWLPLSTAKNVARVLHRFFTEKPNACVALS